MGRNYKNGDIIKFDNNSYKVLGIVGEGASSTVYITREEDNSLHILKEYNPKNIELERDAEGEFNIMSLDDKSLAKYKDGMCKFIQAAEKQKVIRNSYPDMMNNTCIVNGVFEENNTVYIDMSVFDGQSYDKTERENSLQELLIRIKAIAVAVKAYHDNGFLHLDIKPANIFVLGNSTDFVMLFDFDSVIEKEKVGNADVLLSYSAKWAAPEQNNYRYRSLISEKSDIFSIGEILFYKLFDRHSNILERRVFSKYDFSDMFFPEFGNPQICKALNKILRCTLCTNTEKRLSSCDELIELLNDAIALAVPNRKYFEAYKPLCNKNFIGRINELAEIRQLLLTSSIVAIEGMGGVGKTELAYAYADSQIDYYDNILFFTGKGSWLNLVNQEFSKKIINFQYIDEEDEEALFNRVLNFYKDQATNDTLFIIDNVDEDAFSEDNQKYFKDVKSLPGKILLTTRCHFEMLDSFYLETMEFSSLRELFSHWNGNPDCDEDLKCLFEFVGNHTLTVELLSKQMNNDCVSAAEKLKRLREQGLPNLTGKVISSKDMVIHRREIYAHLQALFDTSSLDEKARCIMDCMSLTPIGGVNLKDFLSLIGESSGEIIANLVEWGWIRRRGNTISVHPLIADICYMETKGSLKEEYLRNLEGYIRNNTITKKNEVAALFLSSVDVLLRHNYIGYEYLRLLCLDYYLYLTFLNSYDKAIYYNKKMTELIEDNNIQYFDLYLDGLLNLAELYEQIENNELCAKYLLLSRDNISKLSSENEKIQYDAKCDIVYGRLYCKMGKYDEAKTCLLKALDKVNMLDEKSSLLPEIYNELGAFYKAIADAVASEKYYLMAKTMYEEMFGADSHLVGVVNTNLAYLYKWDEKFELAEKYLIDGISIFEKIYATDDAYQFLWSYSALAQVYMALGKNELAEKYADKALAIAENIFGEENATTGRMCITKAYVLIKEKRISEALSLIDRAIDIFKMPEDMLLMSTSMQRVAAIFEEVEIYDLAIEYFLKSLPGARICCKEYNRHVPGCILKDLGNIHIKIGKVEKAKEFLTEAYDYFGETYGEEHEYAKDVLKVLESLNN